MSNKRTDKDLNPWTFLIITMVVLYIVNQIEKF